MIRIDEIRALHHDLHMRPFEADRRVYLILDAHRMNDEAAAALLKDLEEPPAYATLVLVADELGPLPETIRSRCQLVPFRRLSRDGRRGVDRRARAGARRTRRRPCSAASPAVVSTVPHGCSTRLHAQRRAALLVAARGTYRDEAFDPAAAAGVILEGAGARGTAAREREQDLVDGLDLPPREAEQRVRRAEFGAERAEVLAALDDLGSLVPRPRRGRERRGERRPQRGPARRAARRRGRRRKAPAPRAPPPSSVRRGARPKSSTSTRRSSWRRSSSACTARSPDWSQTSPVRGMTSDCRRPTREERHGRRGSPATRASAEDRQATPAVGASPRATWLRPLVPVGATPPLASERAGARIRGPPT